MKKLVLSCLLLAACEGGDPTGSTCPTTNPPTYASFGDTFFTNYCRGCHSASADNRHDAPRSQNYDTEDEIKRHADDIDTWAAAGPNATNTDMPDLSGPVKNAPTQAEREMLGQYLACLKAQP